ncbi:MAG: malonyl-ACP O-methyltransferase BioC [Gammaproteobacteria bacterium]|nr:malonyl-ACP O-methyltransferase BioC [Gammaproteobacteria bacterium]
MIKPGSVINKKWIRRAFDKAAVTYDDAAVLQREVCTRMLEHLDAVKMVPETVLDIGAGTGFGVGLLMKRYKKAHITAVDLAPGMLKRVARQGSWLRKPTLICADADHLPIADNSVDMIISSLMLQWSGDLERTFREFRRVLKPGGVLMFASFGPDTLMELRSSWAQVDGDGHVNQFMDMHDVGDALLRSQFADPVMDREMLTLTYQKVTDLMRDLKAIGANTPSSGRRRGLMTAATLSAVEQAYERYRRDGVLPASYEIVYGQAWLAE